MQKVHDVLFYISRIKLSIILFLSPVEDSPASNIPLVNDAARMEVAEDTLLVFCCHDSKDLQIKLSSDQNLDIFQTSLRCRRNHLSKLEVMADNILVGDN